MEHDLDAKQPCCDATPRPPLGPDAGSTARMPAAVVTECALPLQNEGITFVHWGPLLRGTAAGCRQWSSSSCSERKPS